MDRAGQGIMIIVIIIMITCSIVMIIQYPPGPYMT